MQGSHQVYKIIWNKSVVGRNMDSLNQQITYMLLQRKTCNLTNSFLLLGTCQNRLSQDKFLKP